MKSFIVKNFIMDVVNEYVQSRFAQRSTTDGRTIYGFRKYFNHVEIGEVAIFYDEDALGIIIVYNTKIPHANLFAGNLSSALFNWGIEISEKELKFIEDVGFDITNSLGLVEPAFENMNFDLIDGCLEKSLSVVVDYDDIKFTEDVILSVPLEYYFTRTFCDELLKVILPPFIKESEFVESAKELFTKTVLENDIALAEMTVTELLERFETEEEIMTYLLSFYKDKHQKKLDL